MTVPKSRSEGSLLLEVDHSDVDDGARASSDCQETQQSFGSFHSESKRKTGLTKEEAKCFKRRPAPSDSYEDKVAPYWRHIGGMRTMLTQTGANTLPNGKGVFWNGPLFKNTILTTEEQFDNGSHCFSPDSNIPHTSSNQPQIARHEPTSTKSRRAGCLKGQKAAQAPHPLDVEEEHLADILCYLFPSTRAQMARVGSSCRRRRAQTPASRESIFRAQSPLPLPPRDEKGQCTLDATMSSQAFTDTQRLGSSQQCLSATTSSMRNTSCSGTFPVSPTKATSSGTLTRKRTACTDVLSDAGDFAKQKPKQNKSSLPQPWLNSRPSFELLSSNAMKLVAGASNSGSVHRDLGGGVLTFSHDPNEGNRNHKAVVHAVNRAASSVNHLFQAMADDKHKAHDAESSTSRGCKSPSKLEFRSTVSRAPTMALTHEAKDTLKHTDPKAFKERVHQEHFEQSTFSLRDFRKRILDRFSTVMEAFNSMDIDSSKKLTIKEWNVVLFQAGLANYREARMLFEVMDANKDGQLTMLEFHVGLEAIAPVHSLEALRKRLLCLGFTSMWQAILVMDGADPRDERHPAEDTTCRPLTFNEFSDALRHTLVSEPSEHRAIFEAVRSDPGPRTTDARVSLVELACALAAVSPSLLLEDVRFKLTKRFKTVPEIWQHLTFSESGGACDTVLDVELFEEHGCKRLGLTRYQAEKMFRLMDIDQSGHVSRLHFVRAFNVSNPSLLQEDNRHKVRQRYLSIDVAFRHAFENMEDEDLDDESALDIEELADILEKLEMSRKCSKRLFHLIDANSLGKLTLREFFQGIRIYAPSVMLEGVRLQVLQHGKSIADQLCSVVKDRRAPLDVKAFRMLLNKLDVQCDHIESIFKFLDVRDVGTVSISQLIAALQNMQSGGTCKVDRHSLQEHAEHVIKAEMAPFRKTCTDLKRCVKQGLREDDVKPVRKTSDGDEAHGTHGTHGRLPRIGPRRAKSMPLVGERHGESEAAGVQLPSAGTRLLSADGVARSCPSTAQGPRSTFQKLNSRLKEVQCDGGQNTFRTTMSHLRGYFNSAHSTLQDHGAVFSQSYTRIDLHRSARDLKLKLDPQMVEFRKAADAARV